MRFAMCFITLACFQSWMFGVCSICSIRYCDIVLESEEPRTRITTRSANLAKFIAAWPAECSAEM